MGLVDASSTSQATDNRIGAGDNATINKGPGLTFSAPGSLALGKNATFVAGSDLSNSKIMGDVRITNTDPALFQALTHLAAQNSSDLTTLVEAQNETLTGTLGAVLSEISGLAENQQTGGQASSNKTVLYIVIVALLAAVFIFGKD